MFTLASASPRRRELLAQVGLEPRVAVYAIDETPRPSEVPADYVCRMAEEKLLTALQVETGVVLAADTVVVYDFDVLGKPKDEADNVQMLGRLSGQTHAVITAVAVGTRQDHTVRAVRSEVRFAELSPSIIERYVASGEGLDKAGGYGIQGVAGGFVAGISGSYSAIVGLPLFESVELLRAAGAIPAWP
ncbi:MAG: septum formation protein [Polyangiales bacterium]|jgi:septum formation protein